MQLSLFRLTSSCSDGHQALRTIPNHIGRHGVQCLCSGFDSSNTFGLMDLKPLCPHDARSFIGGLGEGFKRTWKPERNSPPACSGLPMGKMPDGATGSKETKVLWLASLATSMNLAQEGSLQKRVLKMSKTVSNQSSRESSMKSGKV